MNIEMENSIYIYALLSYKSNNKYSRKKTHFDYLK